MVTFGLLINYNAWTPNKTIHQTLLRASHFDTHTDSIYIRHMSGERLPAHSISNVPQFGGRVAGARHKGLGVWTEGQAHHISAVACECGRLLTSLYIPQSTAKEKDNLFTFSTGSSN